MAPNQRNRKKRKSKKSNKGGLSFGSIGVQLSLVLLILFIVFFLIAGKIISNITGAVLCMVSLSILSYFIATSPKKSRRRRRRPKNKPAQDEPQFYTALPSTVGLTEIPEEFSTTDVKLPPRPAKTVRHQREFVIYPNSVGSGDYSDSYIQINNNTVLRLRGEMVPQMGTKFLPGSRLPSFPSADEIAEALENIVPNQLITESSAEPVVAAAEPVALAAEPVVAAEPVAVAAEPVAVAAEPVAVAAEPVAVAAEPVAVAAEPVAAVVPSQSSEEDEEMDFDMEWD